MFAKARVHPFIFFGSSLFLWIFVLYTILWQDSAKSLTDALHSFITTHFSWWYILMVAATLIFCFVLMVSRLGDLKLGRDDDAPDFSFASWLSMLFSAGMGIGILFYAVAEPVTHYLNTPESPGARFGEAGHALKVTFFHWGLHAWAIYVTVGLSLAYFTHRKGEPLSIRFALRPLIGKMVDSKLGYCIDILAVLGTLFGVATSLGLGVIQINSGLDHLYQIGISTGIQIGLIVFVTLLATISVVSGVNKGIKLLSQFNILVAILLVLFIFCIGPTVKILDLFVQNIGVYLQGLPNVTFHTSGRKDSTWMSSWTLFYWGWWMAWAPFVGMFIARISKGRTVREFIAAVLFVPSLFTFFWFTVFGETAIHLIEGGNQGIIEAVKTNLPVALFVFLEAMPLGSITSGLAVIVIFTFFITSSDSGSFVIDMITSGGSLNPAPLQKIYWALMEGLVAAVLLLAGGLQSLQIAAICAALPFSVVILLMMISLIKAMREEAPQRK